MKTTKELEKRIMELEGRIAQLEADVAKREYHYHFYPPVQMPQRPVSVPSVWDSDTYTVPYQITATRAWWTGDPVTGQTTVWNDTTQLYVQRA